MPVPTSPVRPVPTTPRRARARLPALLVTLALLASLGWVSLTPDGRALAAPPLADLLVRLAEPPDCAHPWSAWAGLMTGAVPIGALDPCAAPIVVDRFRRDGLRRMIATRSRPAAVREAGARVLLLGLVDAAPEVLANADLDPLALVDAGSFLWIDADPDTLAAALPLRGSFDRSLALRDADPSLALAALGPVADELPEADRRRLRLGALRPAGLPGSALEPAGPGVAPPASGSPVLDFVPERARDHVAAEWAALVRYVREGPGDGVFGAGGADGAARTDEGSGTAGPAAGVERDAAAAWTRPDTLTPPPSAELRWRAAMTSRAGAPVSSVHAVLRGDPAPPAVGAWLSWTLAADAGLALEARRTADGYRLTAAAQTLEIDACGLRFAGVPRREPGETVDPSALRADAAAALASGRLRGGDLEGARELLAGGGPAALVAVLTLGDAVAPAGISAPVPVLLRPPKVRRGRAGSGRATAGADGTESAAAAVAVAAWAAPDDPGERALVAWWAVHFGAMELARTLADAPSTGAFEAVRLDALAAMGEPGVASPGLPGSACLPAVLPWPPASAGP